MKLPLILRQWRWEIIEQLLRWGLNMEEKEDGWLKKGLRKVVLKVGLIL